MSANTMTYADCIKAIEAWRRTPAKAWERATAMMLLVKGQLWRDSGKATWGAFCREVLHCNPNAPRHWASIPERMSRPKFDKIGVSRALIVATVPWAKHREALKDAERLELHAMVSKYRQQSIRGKKTVDRVRADVLKLPSSVQWEVYCDLKRRFAKVGARARLKKAA